MKLTEKQKRFADYYIETGNATDSAIRAGYSEKTAKSIGQENLTKPYLKKYIEDRMKEMASKRIMGATEALELLTSIARGEMTEEVIVTLVDGIKRVEKKPDIKDRHKALEALLKRYPISRHDELKDKLLEAQIDKIKAETPKEDESSSRVVIINDKEAMRKAMQDENS